MEPSKSNPEKDNKPETNKPLTGTEVIKPGESMSAGALGDLNSRVVAPYGHANLGPERPSKQVSEQLPAVHPPSGVQGAHNERPATMATKTEPSRESQDYVNRDKYPAASPSKLAPGQKVIEQKKSDPNEKKEGVIGHRSEG